MSSVTITWSVPNIHSHGLVTNVLHLETPDDNVSVAPTWIDKLDELSDRSSCRLCLEPQAKNPVAGCFCTSASRAKGLPAQMTINFSEAIVSAPFTFAGSERREYTQSKFSARADQMGSSRGFNAIGGLTGNGLYWEWQKPTRLERHRLREREHYFRGLRESSTTFTNLDYTINVDGHSTTSVVVRNLFAFRPELKPYQENGVGAWIYPKSIGVSLTHPAFSACRWWGGEGAVNWQYNHPDICSIIKEETTWDYPLNYPEYELIYAMGFYVRPDASIMAPFSSRYFVYESPTAEDNGQYVPHIEYAYPGEHFPFPWQDPSARTAPWYLAYLALRATLPAIWINPGSAVEFTNQFALPPSPRVETDPRLAYIPPLHESGAQLYQYWYRRTNITLPTMWPAVAHGFNFEIVQPAEVEKGRIQLDGSDPLELIYIFIIANSPSEALTYLDKSPLRGMEGDSGWLGGMRKYCVSCKDLDRRVGGPSTNPLTDPLDKRYYPVEGYPPDSPGRLNYDRLYYKPEWGWWDEGDTINASWRYEAYLTGFVYSIRIVGRVFVLDMYGAPGNYDAIVTGRGRPEALSMSGLTEPWPANNEFYNYAWRVDRFGTPQANAAGPGFSPYTYMPPSDYPVVTWHGVRAAQRFYNGFFGTQNSTLGEKVPHMVGFAGGMHGPSNPWSIPAYEYLPKGQTPWAAPFVRDWAVQGINHLASWVSAPVACDYKGIVKLIKCMDFRTAPFKPAREPETGPVTFPEFAYLDISDQT